MPDGTSQAPLTLCSVNGQINDQDLWVGYTFVGTLNFKMASSMTPSPFLWGFAEKVFELCTESVWFLGRESVLKGLVHRSFIVTSHPWHEWGVYL